MIRAAIRCLRSLSPLGLYRVAGDSMLPTYRSGDTLLGLHWFRPRPGQVVVATSPTDSRPLIKRIARLTTATAYLLGDNPTHSTDSRHFGPVPRTRLQAHILCRLP